jgi:hypothetical protein
MGEALTCFGNNAGGLIADGGAAAGTGAGTAVDVVTTGAAAAGDGRTGAEGVVVQTAGGAEFAAGTGFCDGVMIVGRDACAIAAE